MPAPDGRTSVESTVVIDCEPKMPGFAASYLLLAQAEAAFVDNYTRHAVPHLLAALKQHGFSPESVKYVIITHVHLDHAGGTADLMAACPNALLLAHPKAARHMIDPAKLIKAVSQVYGERFYDETYAPIRPVDAARVRAIEDNETVRLGDRTLRFIHTRGHANHHMCIFDETTREIFTGDAFGVAYPALQHGKLFIFPTTSPSEYDGQLACEAIDKIVALKPKVAYPTHFGPVENIEAAALTLNSDLHRCDDILQAARQLGTEVEIYRFCKSAVRSFFRKKYEDLGFHWSDEAENLLKLDMDLNADGLACQAVVRNKRAAESS